LTEPVATVFYGALREGICIFSVFKSNIYESKEKLMEIKEKRQAPASFARKDGDTGSPEVQVASLTQRINEISVHLKSHSKDNSTRRGLIAMVNRRRRLLSYLSKEDHDKYLKITEQLGIRRK